MLSETDLPDEVVQDGLAFSRLMEDPKAWPALLRLVAKFNADAIDRWEQDKTGECSRKWLRGYREASGDFLPRIAAMAQAALAHVESKKVEKVVLTRSEEGMGSGDLAIS